MIPSIDQGTKDWLQALAWLAAAVGFVLTAIRFGWEFRQGRLQRDRDLRWRQAEAGKSLNDEMQTDQRAWAAMQMLDSQSREFVLPNEEHVTITRSDLVKALDLNEPDDEKTVYIRDCFDTFFYFMAMLHHYISNTLIKPEDVAYPMEYYVRKMTDFRPQVEAYLNHYGLWRTLKFLQNQPAWQITTDKSTHLVTANPPSNPSSKQLT